NDGLPLVLPIVLAQVAGGWRVSAKFSDLFDFPQGLRAALGRFVPNFEYVLIDLDSLAFDKMPGNDEVRLVLGLMKAVMEKRLRATTDWLMEHLRPIDSEELLDVVLAYVFDADSTLSLKEFEEKLHSANNPKATRSFMSIAERLQRE